MEILSIFKLFWDTCNRDRTYEKIEIFQKRGKTANWGRRSRISMNFRKLGLDPLDSLAIAQILTKSHFLNIWPYNLYWHIWPWISKLGLYDLFPQPQSSITHTLGRSKKQSGTFWGYLSESHRPDVVGEYQVSSISIFMGILGLVGSILVEIWKMGSIFGPLYISWTMSPGKILSPDSRSAWKIRWDMLYYTKV